VPRKAELYGVADAAHGATAVGAPRMRTAFQRTQLRGAVVKDPTAVANRRKRGAGLFTARGLDVGARSLSKIEDHLSLRNCGGIRNASPASGRHAPLAQVRSRLAEGRPEPSARDPRHLGLEQDRFLARFRQTLQFHEGCDPVLPATPKVGRSGQAVIRDSDRFFETPVRPKRGGEERREVSRRQRIAVTRLLEITERGF